MIDLARLDRLARRARVGRGLRGTSALPGRRLAFHRGYGLSLAGYREYGFGDDVRHLDWRVTARLGRPFVKTFLQESSGTVLVLVDASASIRDAADGHGLAHRTLEAAALVVLMAAHAQERVGLAQFTDRIEWLHRPQRGRQRAHAAIRAMEQCHPRSRRTSLATVLAEAGHLLPGAGTIVIVSDFIDDGYEATLHSLRRRYDVLALCLAGSAPCVDEPARGLLRARDPETGRTRWLDTRSAHVRTQITTAGRARTEQRRAMFEALGVPCYEADGERAAEGIWLRVGERL